MAEGSVACCGEVSGDVEPPVPSSMRATIVLMATVFPSSTRTSCRRPAPGEGISVSTLSVEISKSGSSRSTCSPGFFSHFVSVPSTMLSPIWGITTSVISVLAFQAGEGGLHHLAIEYAAEMDGQTTGNFFKCRAGSACRHRRYRLGEPAGHDVLEVAEIGRDVEGKPVRGNPAADVNADGGNLPLTHPHSGQLRD